MANFTELLQFDPRYKPPERADNVAPMTEKFVEGYNFGITKEENARAQLTKNLKIQETLRDFNLRDNPPPGLMDALSVLYDPLAEIDQPTLQKHMKTLWTTLGPERAGGVLESFHQVRREEFERKQNEIPLDLVRGIGKTFLRSITDPAERQLQEKTLDETLQGMIDAGHTGMANGAAVALITGLANLAGRETTAASNLERERMKQATNRARLAIDRMLAKSTIGLNSSRAQMYRSISMKNIAAIENADTPEKLTKATQDYALGFVSGMSAEDLKYEKKGSPILTLQSRLLAIASRIARNDNMLMIDAISEAAERYNIVPVDNEKEAKKQIERLTQVTQDIPIKPRVSVNEAGDVTGADVGPNETQLDDQVASIAAFMLNNEQHTEGSVEDAEVIRQFRQWETSMGFEVSYTDEQIIERLNNPEVQRIISRKMQE